MRVGDAAVAWEQAGFTLTGSGVIVGRTRIFLAGAGHGEARGISSIAIAGIGSDIDAIPVHEHTSPVPGPPEHANLIDRIDHLVVATPDCDRTTTALEAAGLESRRVRTFEARGATQRQTFFWMGDVILELVGPDSASGEGPPQLWGLAFTSPDLQSTADALGEHCSPPRDALQSGRRICTLKTRDLDISIAIAIMSPHPSESRVS